MLLPFLLSLALLPATAPAAPWCRADLDRLAEAVSSSYAGYPEAVSALGADTLAARTTRLAAAAERADTPEACEAVLQAWIDLFGDRHMGLWRTDRFGGTTEGGPRETPPLADPPSVTFPDDSTAVIRLPSMDLRWRAAVDSLVAAHHAALTSRPWLVVDVTSNTGGSDATYRAVAALLDSGPYRTAASEHRVTPHTLAFWRFLHDLPATSDASRAEIAARIDSLEAAAGPYWADPAEWLTPDTVYAHPSRVVVLTDARSASSAETFVLRARQSRKVTVAGRPTMGTVDTGNVFGARLPSGRLGVGIPTSRFRWPGGGRYDPTGILPDVEIPAWAMGSPETRLAFARGLIAARAAPPTR